MNEIVIWLIPILLLIIANFLWIIFKKTSRVSSNDTEKAVRDELRIGREESAKSASDLRQEMSKQLMDLTGANLEHLEKLRETIDTRLQQIQDGNEKKLDEMRQTVDKHLQGTLEKRLGESFRLVSDQLESVQRGLGEMQSLAIGVGD